MALVFHILHDAEKVASVVASWNPLINLIMLRLLDLKSSDETICRMDCCTIKRYISFSPLLLTTQPAQQLNDGKANAAASKARPVPLPRSRKLSPIQTWTLACQICIDLPEIHSWKNGKNDRVKPPLCLQHAYTLTVMKNDRSCFLYSKTPIFSVEPLWNEMNIKDQWLWSSASLYQWNTTNSLWKGMKESQMNKSQGNSWKGQSFKFQVVLLLQNPTSWYFTSRLGP